MRSSPPPSSGSGSVEAAGGGLDTVLFCDLQPLQCNVSVYARVQRVYKPNTLPAPPTVMTGDHSITQLARIVHKDEVPRTVYVLQDSGGNVAQLVVDEDAGAGWAEVGAGDAWLFSHMRVVGKRAGSGIASLLRVLHDDPTHACNTQHYQLQPSTTAPTRLCTPPIALPPHRPSPITPLTSTLLCGPSMGECRRLTLQCVLVLHIWQVGGGDAMGGDGQDQ